MAEIAGSLTQAMKADGKDFILQGEGKKLLAAIVLCWVAAAGVAWADDCPSLAASQYGEVETEALIEAAECALLTNDNASLAIELYEIADAREDIVGKAGLAEALIARDTPADRQRAILLLEDLIGRFSADAPLFAAELFKFNIDLAELLRRAQRPEEAVERYDNALLIQQDHPEAADIELGAIALQNKGVALESLARYAAALDAYRRASSLTLAPGAEETRRQAALLSNTAVINWKLGETDRAIDRLNAAIDLMKDMRASAELASAYSNLGLVLAEAGDREPAVQAIRQALNIRELVFGADADEVANAANNLGVALTLAGRHEQAQTELERALAIRARSQPSNTAQPANIAGAAQILDSLAENSLRAGNRRDALQDSLVAIGIWEEELLAHSDDLRQAYERVAAILKTEGFPRASTVFAKLGVNAHQRIKKANQELEDSQSRRLTTRYGDLYADLVDTLVGEGSFAQARFVADLRKQREFEQFFDSQFVPDAVQQHDLRLSEDDRALHALLVDQAKRHRNERLTRRAVPAGAAPLPVEALPVEARRRHARSAAGRKPDASADPTTLQAEAGADLIKGTSAGILRLLASENRLHLFLTSPGQETIHRQVDIQRDALARLVHSAADASENRRPEALGHLQALHAVLVAPIENDLEAASIDTLVLNLSGFLRYVPFAALHSGGRFLVEDYAIAYLNPSPGVAGTAMPGSNRGVGFGMTRAAGPFPALEGARREIETLFSGTDRPNEPESGGLTGATYLDERFNEASLLQELSRQPAYVHIASHFRFRPDEPDHSFLLMGDASGLTLRKIASDERFSFAGVELLALSACDTGRDGGRDGGAEGAEMESLGVVAQAKGARSVMATLWPISDGATVSLMASFYRNMVAGGMGKAKALQAAQVAALRSTDKILPSAERGAESLKPRETSAPHPMLWAPFIIMGDWR